MDFDVRAGEILGVTGLVGSGFEDVPYLLFGARPAAAGELELDGTRDLTRLDPCDACAAGLALLPADRQVDGSVGDLPVRDNLMLQVLDAFRGGSGCATGGSTWRPCASSRPSTSARIGLIGGAEMIESVAAIRAATTLPLIADADTGYGDVNNVRHTVRRLEALGVAAIQIEDQDWPKRCGHLDIERCRRYLEAGADVAFVTGRSRSPSCGASPRRSPTPR